MNTDNVDDLDNQHGWDGVGLMAAALLAIDLLMAVCVASMAGLSWGDVLQILVG